jgi:hypothetical protein
MPGNPNDLISVAGTFMSSSVGEINALQPGEIAFDGTNLVGRDATGIIILRTIGVTNVASRRGGSMTFTSNGTLSRSTLGSATMIGIIAVGGGGGSGATARRSSRSLASLTYTARAMAGTGGGGGGGGFSELITQVSNMFPTPTSTANITVGFGGSGGANTDGGSGGTSSFSGFTSVSAPGGLGGTAGRCATSTTTAFGVGGTAGAGGVNGSNGVNRNITASGFGNSAIAPPNYTTTNAGSVTVLSSTPGGVGGTGGSILGTATRGNPLSSGYLSGGTSNRGGGANGPDISSATPPTISSGVQSGIEIFTSGMSGAAGFVYVWWW